MTFTVRLNRGLEREFAAACRLKRTTKSAAVTELIRAYVRGQAPAKSAFELAEEMGLVGCVARAPAAGPTTAATEIRASRAGRLVDTSALQSRCASAAGPNRGAVKRMHR